MPRVLRDALQQLASEADVRFIAAVIQDAIEQYEGRDHTIIPEISFDALPDDNWCSGVETFMELTTEQLWLMLGLANQKLPNFNADHDSENIHDRWDKSEAAWFADKANLVPLEPRWHQLVGILKMLHLAFDGKPVLLMDEVGVGKTMQVVGLIAMLAYYREFWDKNQDYPGIFGRCSVVLSLFTQSHKSLSGKEVPRRDRRHPRPPSDHLLPCLAAEPVVVRAAQVPRTAVVRPVPLCWDIGHKARLLGGSDEER